jgi:ferredoxin
MEFQSEYCGYCGSCVTVCPEGILELSENLLNVDTGCTECGNCVYVCPLGALIVGKDND